MNQYSLNEIKKELLNKDEEELLTLCLRMAKYKKENKELLSYLLFESKDESAFINSVQNSIDEQFDNLIENGSYKYMKQIRKISKSIGKPMKYSGIPSTEIEILIYYCEKLKPIVEKKHTLTALQIHFGQQLKKIGLLLDKLHEDIQYDYKKPIENLLK